MQNVITNFLVFIIPVKEKKSKSLNYETGNKPYGIWILK